MKVKYFTPDIEDIYIGYECESTNNGTNWYKWKFEESSFSVLKLELLNNMYRTPYLTKKQIENEGWKSESAPGFYTKGEFELYYNQLWNNDREFQMNILKQPNFLFQGKCKDINTFRKILKLLEI